MPVPTHAPDCVTRMFPTRCTACGASVYYFSCTCGSAVLFDGACPPFHNHLDSCWGTIVNELHGEGNWSAEQIRSLVETVAEETGNPVPHGFWQRLNEIDGGKQVRRVMQALPDKPTDATGTVVQANPHVNFFRRFALPETAICRGLLGVLASEPHDDVTLREDKDQHTHVIAEFRFFVVHKVWQGANLTLGSRARVWLNPHALPNAQVIWLCARALRVRSAG